MTLHQVFIERSFTVTTFIESLIDKQPPLPDSFIFNVVNHNLRIVSECQEDYKVSLFVRYNIIKHFLRMKYLSNFLHFELTE